MFRDARSPLVTAPLTEIYRVLAQSLSLFILGQASLEELLEFSTELNSHLHKIILTEKKYLRVLCQTGLNRETTTYVVQQLNFIVLDFIFVRRMTVIATTIRVRM